MRHRAQFPCCLRVILTHLTYFQDVEHVTVKYSEPSTKISTSKCSEPRTAYDHEALSEAVESLVQEAPITSDRKTFLEDACDFNDNDACRTLVLTTPLHGSGSQALRLWTYGTTHNDAFRAEILETARATLAAHSLFHPVRINRITYGVGGMGWRHGLEQPYLRHHVSSSR